MGNKVVTISKQITIRDDLYNKIKDLKEAPGCDELSYSKVIDSLYQKIANLEFENRLILEEITEATINREGRFEGSKGLAGKIIIYKVK
jgi:predicted CopG family antitoxin